MHGQVCFSQQPVLIQQRWHIPKFVNLLVLKASATQAFKRYPNTGSLSSTVSVCHMQGTLKWSTGERYDGEWANGQENGIGIFTWPDGSTFNGFWEHGKKNGAEPVAHCPGTCTVMRHGVESLASHVS